MQIKTTEHNGSRELHRTCAHFLITSWFMWTTQSLNLVLIFWLRQGAYQLHKTSAHFMVRSMSRLRHLYKTCNLFFFLDQGACQLHETCACFSFLFRSRIIQTALFSHTLQKTSRPQDLKVTGMIVQLEYKREKKDAHPPTPPPIHTHTHTHTHTQRQKQPKRTIKY